MHCPPQPLLLRTHPGMHEVLFWTLSHAFVGCSIGLQQLSEIRLHAVTFRILSQQHCPVQKLRSNTQYMPPPPSLQVDMCNLSLKLLLHLNSKHSGLNGYSAVGGSAGTPQQQQNPASRPSSLVQELLYATSGCLHNISRNPHNLFSLYEIELKMKTRRAAADLLASGDPRAIAAAAAGRGRAPTGTSASVGTSGAEEFPGFPIKGDHVRGMAHVNIPSIELTLAQYEVGTRGNITWA